jgi:hypothetical protein
MKGWFLILGAVAVFSLACSDFFSSADSDRTMILRGTVTDADTDAPIEGVLVSLEWTLNDTTPGSASRHIDALTDPSGTYEISTRLREVNCNTLWLFFAKAGYDATRRFPDCKGGRQTFNAELNPE